MKVLIGITTHNRADILARSIQSALDQDYADKEIAVVDDASTDDTPLLRSQFRDVTWLRAERNRGYMVARNHLMALDGSDYFVSLDDDAWFLQGDEIAISIDYMMRHSNVAAVAFDIISPDRPTSVPRTEPQPAAMFIGCGHVLRLAAVRQVGGYEAAPGSYGGEEKDLCLRLLDAEYQIVKLPGVHVWHDKTAVARNIAAQHRSGVCNDLVFTLRRTPVLLLPIAMLTKFYRHWRFSVRSSLTYPCFQGFGIFIRSAPRIWRSRQPVRAATLRSFLRLSAQNSQAD